MGDRSELLFVFVMAGGSGERFWPLSRTRTPKHLLRLVSEKTLLAEAVDRARALVPLEQVFILTNRTQVEGCLEALPDFPPSQILAEPAKRDTAPACAFATAYCRARQKEGICALFPADAVIKNVESFCRNVWDAAELAEKNDVFVTFAIRPTYPSTGFGYLELGKSLPSGRNGSRIWQVQRFVEKPRLEVAREYVKSGNYAWNSGMFVWKAEFFHAECRRLNIELASFIEEFPTGDFSSYLEARFPKLPKISVDFAIMEKAKDVCAIGADFDWDDLG
ncbi:MAG: mannose-1-phosphate guanylyltransferase, partial [Chthoniobacterales bacterium]|nr:mannose-1-phosphate guanylyltransferase [Chthoniobacterales bacterium]